MIKRENESVKLEFGTGDICVAGGYIEQERGGGERTDETDD